MVAHARLLSRVWMLAGLFAGSTVVAFAVNSASSPSPNYSPKIQASQFSGWVGTPIDIYGSGFPPNATLGIYVDTPSSYAATPSRLNEGGPQTDANGSFHTSIFMPVEPEGQHSICADSGYPGSTETYGVKACWGFLVQPHVTLDPSVASPGSTMIVSGTGFTPGTIAALYQDVPEENLGTPGPIVESMGTFSSGVTIKPAAPGQHNICAQVLAAAPPHSPVGLPVCTAFSVGSEGPAITLTPDSGPPLTPITIVGHGFAPNTDFLILIGDNAYTCVSGRYPHSTDASGGFRVQTAMPPIRFNNCETRALVNLQPGLQQICVRTLNQQDACAPFDLEYSTQGTPARTASPPQPAQPTSTWSQLVSSKSPAARVALIAGIVLLLVAATGVSSWFVIRGRRGRGM